MCGYDQAREAGRPPSERVHWPLRLRREFNNHRRALNRLAEAARLHSVPSMPSSPKFVRRVIAARAARRQFFTADLFADPAWDILLELYALHCEQQRTSVSKLCVAVAVPATTALRWIDRLESDGLLDRSPDPLDARRIWVSLSVKGLHAMNSYVEHIGPGTDHCS